MAEQAKEKSILLEDKEKALPQLVYTDEQKKYLGNLQIRLREARNARDNAKDEFDGMSYVRYCEENRKMSNSYVQPKQNKEDTHYHSGTIRQKQMAVLAAINNLDLSPDINVFDKDDVELANLGQALEDINWKTEEMDGDEEKKLLRQYTLMEQGTVFVNEDWIEKVGWEKKITKDFDGKTAEWEKRLVKIFDGASREIVQNEKVYLGDITQIDMDNQPYVYTVEIMPYSVAEQIYGQWENWKYVSHARKRFFAEDNNESSLYNRNFVLTDIQDGQVEIIKYQDLPNNEYQIIINSILMLPIGFPRPWKHRKYSLVKQIFSIISPQFAYGKSFPSLTRLQVAVWDEMLRLMVLKTQQSFKPPMGNLTGRVLSSRILHPGVFTAGINPENLKRIDPEGARGINNGEVAALNLIKQNIDQLTINPVAGGQNPEGTPTATQIIEVQRQAKLVLGLTIFVCSMLEKKLAEIRMMNIMERWFSPVDDVVDSVRGVLTDRYRSFTRKAPIEGEGVGQRIIRIVPQLKSEFAIFKEEERVKQETGVPTRITEINPEVISNAKYQFFISIVAREKRSSPTSKLMFREMLADLPIFERPDQGVGINWAYLADRFAVNWEENTDKMFIKTEALTPEEQAMMASQGQSGQGTSMGKPKDAQRPRVSMKVGLPT